MVLDPLPLNFQPRLFSAARKLLEVGIFILETTRRFYWITGRNLNFKLFEIAMTSITDGYQGRNQVRGRPLFFRRGYPLRITIAFVFKLLTFFSGITLISFNYFGNERTTVLATHDLLRRIRDQVTTHVSELLGPVQSVVNISSKTIKTVGQSFDELLGLLEHFVEILRLNHQLSSMYVADVDEDFFIVRSVENNPEAGKAFQAPRGTHFVVQGIDRELDEMVSEQILFLDEKLFLVSSKSSEASVYDHRMRTWFKAAVYSHELITTDYYVLFATQEIGITVARRLKEGQGVVAADLTLRELSAKLTPQKVTPSTELILLDSDSTVVAHTDYAKIAHHLNQSKGGKLEMPNLEVFDHPIYTQLADTISGEQHLGLLELNNGSQKIMGFLSEIPIRKGQNLYLASLIPRHELLRDVNRLRNQSILISMALLAVTIMLVFWLARRMSRSLHVLAREAQDIREFKLDTPISVRSRILEVNNLADTMAVMRSPIKQFLIISKALSGEKNFDTLLDMILREAQGVANADAIAISLRRENQSRLEVTILRNDRTGIRHGRPSDSAVPVEPIVLQCSSNDHKRLPAVCHAVLTGEVVQVIDLAADDRFDYQDIRTCFERDDYQCKALLIVPLINQKDEIIGALQLVNPRKRAGDVAVFNSEIVSYIEALSSDAAVALDNRRLLKAQRDLIDSIIHLVAAAIDAKSPYTGGHCHRVPVIARMLAEAAQKSDEGPFRDFQLSDEEWYELHLASWLHDCGKVTTPEYVVDKATKLETIYNRIHEIRMRFEVLWRDAEIAYYEKQVEGAGSDAELRRQRDERLAQIQDDFEFVAQCNIGGEFMSEDRVKRLRQIASQTWLRHLDDRIGVSQEELERKQRDLKPDLPAFEPLLADKTEHVAHRRDGGNPFGTNPYGFNMKVPEYMYNYGEIYNLAIPKGTLTPEERFKINDHIIQTIKMLKSLPLPRDLQRVPDWAGNHHEAICGHGYPRGLVGSHLSIPERIMAVADVFEALTAADRPYKTARSISNTIQIMSGMCRQGHICPDIFRLLLTSGVYQRYAEIYLDPDLIDEVNVRKIPAATDAPVYT
jgi:HD-GYP domain-containing protein (c-di-GMP phosphodiesterase class II)